MTEPIACSSRVVDALKREIAGRSARPQSTYRLQMDGGAMDYRHAAAIVPYLHELGISHLYTSPDRKARAGSSHGYAIVDYDSLNPELGAAEDYQLLVEALRTCGMGRIADIVPNHMSAAAGENPWWTDVLENGPSSPYAACFDIEWQPVKEELKNRLLLPLLAEQYGEVLESGQICVEYREGAFGLRLYGALLPLDPKTYPRILARSIERLKETLPADLPDLLELESILTALDHLPDRNQQSVEAVRERQREKEMVKKRLGQLTGRCGAVADFVQENLLAINGTPGNPGSFDELHQLLDAQVYRLAHWKSAGDEINYRRFFDINDLTAICMEDPAVFERSHRLVFEMLLRREISGLRIDHIDGLFDPTEYLWKLQQEWIRTLGRKILAEMTETRQGTCNAGLTPNTPDLLPEGTATSAEMPGWSDLELAIFPSIFDEFRGKDLPLFVVVEKILGPEEPLPAQWPVAGTTGYDFLRSVNGVFVDWDGLLVLKKSFDRFAGRAVDFREVVYESKLSVLRSAMSSELQLLARRLNRLSESHRRFRDFTLNMLRHSLREIIACFAIYRTYLRPQEITERDRRFVARATAQAKRRNPELPAGTFDFVRDVLLFEQPAPLDPEGCRERALFVGRFQQVTSPVMAKGVEDTAYYRYFPLSSLNEVGDDPAGRPVSVESFHRENASRQAAWPGSLLGTTTHDTKRSEDARARINVLSEIPQEWARMVNRWSRLNRRHRRDVDGAVAPSRGDEYLFYQSLLGIWPLEPPDAETQREIVARLQAYMEKAVREAKLQTSWVNPNAGYESAVREFIAAVLTPAAKNRFVAQFMAFMAEIVRFGLFNALGQVLLKLTSPGVPDIYQGQELWDFSLVDPDNRRPVDFALRQRLLTELQRAVGRGPTARRLLAKRLTAEPIDPRLKLYVVWQALQYRRARAELFARGEYIPLTVSGARAEHVCAFAWRTAGNESLDQFTIVAVPRLMARLARSIESSADRAAVPLGQVWQDTRIALPFAAPGKLANLFTGQPCPSYTDGIGVADVFAEFPVAILADA